MTLALFVPRASVVHRTPAGAKLLALAGLSVLVFTVPTLPVVVGALVGVVVVGLVVARLPASVLLRQGRAVHRAGPGHVQGEGHRCTIRVR